MAQHTDLTLPNTNRTCTVYRWPFEHARSEKKMQSGVIISSTEPLLWTLRPRPPLPPPSPLSKGPKWSLVYASWTVSPCAAAPLRNRDVPEAARLLDGRLSFPKVKYSPSESESANKICNILTVQIFISHLAIFSHKAHNLLTRYELNCFRINDTIAHLLCYFLEHFE